MDEEKCKHEKYTTTHKMVVVKLPELESWQMILKVKITCAICKKPFTFRARHGFSTREPVISNDEAELRVPIDYPKEEGEDDYIPPLPVTDLLH